MQETSGSSIHDPKHGKDNKLQSPELSWNIQGRWINVETVSQTLITSDTW